MMRLKHLADNRELALLLLGNWGYDRNRLDVLDQYRISANAIYPFYWDGKLLFLRFAPLEEKSVAYVQAELDFLNYLKQKGFGASETIPARNGDHLLQCNTPWGDYTAVVFERAPGQRADRIAGTAEFYYQYGKTLGRLHTLSRDYPPPLQPRPDWAEHMNWIESCLQDCRAPKSALQEVKRVRESLSQLAKTPDNYGLIHYDYELDNVFYDSENGQVIVIDFDDAHYHWFAMDVVATLNNLREEIEEAQVETAQQWFLEGYRSEMEYPDDPKHNEALFASYANLFKYTRCLRSVQEPVENEPDWMSKLRSYLGAMMGELEQGFER